MLSSIRAVKGLGARQVRAFSTFMLPDLPFHFDDLEPYVSADIMKLHHRQHHQTYINNLNKLIAEEKTLGEDEIDKKIKLQAAIKFNGGGHINHSIFWTNLSPVNTGGGLEPVDKLEKAINERFGSFSHFHELFVKQAMGIQGSGWGWLGFNRTLRRLEIATTANQDLLSNHNLIPLLGIDVWEHAYYLQYKNKRQEYVDAICKVIDWSNVSHRYELALNAQ